MGLAASTTQKRIFDKVLFFNPMVRPGSLLNVASTVVSGVGLKEHIVALPVGEGTFRGGYKRVKLAHVNAVGELAGAYDKLRDRKEGGGLPADDFLVLLDPADMAVDNVAAVEIFQYMIPEDDDGEFFCELPKAFSNVPAGSGAHQLKFYTFEWNEMLLEMVFGSSKARLQGVRAPTGQDRSAIVNFYFFVI